MSAVETWKSVRARSLGRVTSGQSQVADCANRGKLSATSARRSLRLNFVHKRPHEIRTLRKKFPHMGARRLPRLTGREFCMELRGSLESEIMIIGEMRRRAAALPEEAAPSLGESLKLLRKNLKDYCRASIRRVMVRFRSLSDRRISSILWIE